MDPNVYERLAIVETKVSTLEEIGPKVDLIYDYIVGSKAQKKLINKGLMAIGGFVAFLGTVWSLVPHK